MAFQDWKFDKRICRRNLERGIITQEEYQVYLDALPDASKAMVPLWEDDTGQRAARRSRRSRKKRDTLVVDDDE